MNLQGLKFCVHFLGCRVNGAEAEALTSAFLAAGGVEDRRDYDVAVIVTCGVTAMADRKSRQLISRLRRARPGACIVVTGCWAQEAELEQVKALGADLLVGNRRKSEIPELVARFSGNFASLREGLSRQWDPLEAVSSPHHSRALVKVQDGCNCRCAFCIVPILRGPSVSRPLSSIVQEIHRLVASGVDEVVLTGVHLGLWGCEWGSGLEELLRALGPIRGLRRIRFGSLEPFGVTEGLLQILADTPVFAPHLHLPLQSGSPTVMRKMRRPGTPDEFRALVSKARHFLGADLHLSTDVMVAFPGEREEDFQATLDLLNDCRVGRVHSFIYSPRPGTAAAALPDQIPRAVAEDRQNRLLRLSSRWLDREASRWLNRDNSVFIEREGTGAPKGHNEAYFEVLFPENTPRGQWVQVRPAAVEKGRLIV